MRRRAASRRLAPTAGSLRAKHAAPLPFIVFDFHPESYRMKLRSFYKTLARLSSPFRVFSAQTPPRGQVFQKNFKKGLDTRRAIWYTLSRSNELAPIAQLDRAFDYESKGHRFESCWVHHNLSENHGFQTFLLSILDIKPSKKVKNRGLSTPVFPISGMKVRDKNACAQ